MLAGSARSPFSRAARRFPHFWRTAPLSALLAPKCPSGPSEAPFWIKTCGIDEWSGANRWPYSDGAHGWRQFGSPKTMIKRDQSALIDAECRQGP